MILALAFILAQTTAPLPGHQPVAGFVAAKITDGAQTANVSGTSLDVNCTAGCSGSGGAGAASLSTNHQWSGTGWVRIVGDETLGTKVQVTGTVPVSAVALPLPAGAATQATLASILSDLQAKADLLETQPVSLASVPSHPVTNAGTFSVQVTSAPTTAVTGTFWQATQPVSAASLPLPAGAATSAGQLPDSHNVTVDNAAGAAAVNIQDGGNSITVDGTFWQATQPISGTIAAVTSITNTVRVDPIGRTSAIKAGQQDVTTSAVALASTALDGVCVKNMISSTVSAFVGPAATSTTTGDELMPGEGRCYSTDNAADVFVVAASAGARVSWSGN